MAVSITLDGDPAVVAKAIADHGSDAVAAGRAVDVVAAAEAIPAKLRTPAFELALAEAHAVRGEPEAAMACLRRANGDAERLEPGAAWRSIAIHFLRGDLEAAREVLDRVGPVTALATEPARDCALLHAWSAQVHRRLGEVERAAAEARVALAISEDSGDDRALAAAHNVAGLVAAMSARPVRAEEHLRNALAAAERASDLVATAQILSSTGTMEFERSGYAEGIAT